MKVGKITYCISVFIKCGISIYPPPLYIDKQVVIFYSCEMLYTRYGTGFPCFVMGFLVFVYLFLIYSCINL